MTTREEKICRIIRSHEFNQFEEMAKEIASLPLEVPAEMDCENWCDKCHLSINNRMIAMKTTRWFKAEILKRNK
jgi:hypothetical protein